MTPSTTTPKSSKMLTDGATATMPICIDDDDDDDDDNDFDENSDEFIQKQILLWNLAKSPSSSTQAASAPAAASGPAAAPAAPAAAATMTGGSASGRTLERRELEALSRQLIRSDISQTQKEQERQDALLAKQLAQQQQQKQAWLNQKPTAQEQQDALYAKQLASQLNEQTDNDEIIAIQLATSMEQEDSYKERKRRLEQEESRGLAYAMQIQQEFEEEVATLNVRQGKEEALTILDARTELYRSTRSNATSTVAHNRLLE